MTKETAMKILKELHGKSLFAERTALETLIPELQESEDERIRKALIRFHKSTIDIDGIKGDRIVAWLEKQGEQKPVVVDFNAKDWYVSKVDGKIHDMTYNSTDRAEPNSPSIIEENPAWSDEDENYLQSAENACEYQYGKNTSTILWLKSLKDRIEG